MFSMGSVFWYLIPVVYLAIIGFIIYLAVRLVQSTEAIARNTEEIARMLAAENRDPE